MKPNTPTIGARESRFIPAATAGIVSRADGEAGPTLEGYAALFNDETVIAGMFRERIERGAFKASIGEDDIRVAFNHSPNFIIGRTSAKTAEFAEDAKGLKYRADPPDTTWAKDMMTSIKRRDITGSSFQFTVERDEDEEWDFTPTKQGKLPLRTIKRARLYEGGPVAFPAYEKTTVSARAAKLLEEAPTVEQVPETAERAAEAPTGDQAAAVASLVNAIRLHERHLDGGREADAVELMDEMRAALRALDPQHELGELKTRTAPAPVVAETPVSDQFDLERELASLSLEQDV